MAIDWSKQNPSMESEVRNEVQRALLSRRDAQLNQEHLMLNLLLHSSLPESRGTSIEQISNEENRVKIPRWRGA